MAKKGPSKGRKKRILIFYLLQYSFSWLLTDSRQVIMCNGSKETVGESCQGVFYSRVLGPLYLLLCIQGWRTAFEKDYKICCRPYRSVLRFKLTLGRYWKKRRKQNFTPPSSNVFPFWLFMRAFCAFYLFSLWILGSPTPNAFSSFMVYNVQ